MIDELKELLIDAWFIITNLPETPLRKQWLEDFRKLGEKEDD